MKYVCSRVIECTIEIEADSLDELLTKLPADPDALLENAEGVAFGSTWTVDDGSRQTEYEDDDVNLARNPLAWGKR